MSVLVKDMDMPTLGCLACDFCNIFVDEPYCRRLIKRVPKATRLENCPLVPVADAVEVVLCNDCKYCLKEDEYSLWCNGFCSPARRVRADDYCSHGAREEAQG